MLCCNAPNPEGEWKDVYGDPVCPRRTGYEWPPDLLQVGAWTVIGTIMVLHYMTQVPMYRNGVLIADCIVASLLLGTVISTKITLELLPQEDKAVFHPKDAPRLHPDELEDDMAPEGMRSCVFCRRYVLASCKHCSVCDKCIPDFDHHCRWLNSCVGGRNYRLFAVFMGSAWLGMAWVVGMSIYTIQWCLRDTDRCKARLYSSYKSTGNAYIAILVFNFIVMLLAGAGLIALGKLIQFHIYLNCTGQTTYEHILKKREKAKAAKGESGNRPKSLLERGCCATRKRRDFKKHSNNAEQQSRAQAETHEPAEGDQQYSGRDGRHIPSSSDSPVLGNEPLQVNL